MNNLVDNDGSASTRRETLSVAVEADLSPRLFALLTLFDMSSPIACECTSRFHACPLFITVSQGSLTTITVMPNVLAEKVCRYRLNADTVTLADWQLANQHRL